MTSRRTTCPQVCRRIDYGAEPGPFSVCMGDMSAFLLEYAKRQRSTDYLISHSVAAEHRLCLGNTEAWGDALTYGLENFTNISVQVHDMLHTGDELDAAASAMTCYGPIVHGSGMQQ